MVTIRHNLDLSYDDILLVEKYRDKIYDVADKAYIDSVYVKVLKAYFKLLDVTKVNTLAISGEKYIKNVLSRHRDSREATYIRMIGDPVTVICVSINSVCDVLPLYHNFESSKGD